MRIGAGHEILVGPVRIGHEVMKGLVLGNDMQRVRASRRGFVPLAQAIGIKAMAIITQGSYAIGMAKKGG